jgi:Rhs element Vgr protein
MSLTSLPPGSAAPTDIVSQKVWINHTVLSNEILLSQFTVQKAFNKVASARLVFVDGSAAERDFALSSGDLFKPGNDISIELGYDGNVETVFEGIIVKHSIKVGQHGSSLLMIEAKDKAIKLTGARKSNYFSEKTDSDIISELITGGGLQSDVEATTFSHKQMVQFDATDWDFIITRAEANSMLVFTDDGKMVVKKPATLGAPAITAMFGSNILEFEAELDARRQAKSVKADSWSIANLNLDQSSDGTANFTETGNLSSEELANVMESEIQLSHPGNLSQQQLQDWADAYALRSKLSKAVGRVRLQGNAAVKPGTLIALSGVGDRFNGNVFVSGVLHHFDGNWTSDVQFGWADTWFYKKEDVMNKPASGLLPGIHGLQIGKVVDINDPEGNYRLKVHVPTITGGDEGIWARVVSLDAGENRGIYFRPQVADEVILGFLNDDPREVIVLGCLHSKDKKALPFRENEEFGFITKEKVKVLLDDANKKLTLSVDTGSGEKTIILNDSGALEMKDENGNSIKMSSSGINIEASGNVTIKGAQVHIN